MTTTEYVWKSLLITILHNAYPIVDYDIIITGYRTMKKLNNLKNFQPFNQMKLLKNRFNYRSLLNNDVELCTVFMCP